MKFQSFTYTDQKGKTSSRQVLVIQEPSDKVSAIDVTELSDVEIGEFAVRYENLRETFLNGVKSLQQTYDLNHKFRQFFPDKMSQLTVEELV